jgi:PPOX class probable F420-dependent enzyme
VLATVAPDGHPRLVPVCYALAADEATHGRLILYTPLDEKRKRASDPHRLARVRDLIARPQVTLLVDRWDEDWRRLAWLRLEGTAVLLEPAGDTRPEHAAAVAALRAKYPQHVRQDLETRPVIRSMKPTQRPSGCSSKGRGGRRSASITGGIRTSPGGVLRLLEM